MRTLEGICRQPGVAMAVVVVVDLQSGLSGLPDGVLREGLKSLRQNLPESEKPEVIIASDTLAVASSVRIPGIRTIGIVSQQNDEPAIPINIPCLAGVHDLLKFARDEVLMILDADNAVLHIDPDVQTVIRYQSVLFPEPTNFVVLEPEEAPISAPDGHAVCVSAVVASIEDAETAIEHGADALVLRLSEMIETVVPLSAFESEVELVEMLAAMAAGRHIYVLVAEPREALIDLAVRLRDYGGISFVEPPAAPDVLTPDEAGDAARGGAPEVTVRPADVTAAKARIKSALDGGHK